MKQKHKGYLNGSLTLTHKVFMAYTKAHFDYLKNTGQWGDKSPDNKKIVAMAAKINALKGQLKLDPKLSTIAKDKKKEDKGENKGKKKNKKDYANKKYQKRDKAWKKVPPKDGKKRGRKQVGKYTLIGATTTWRGRSTNPPIAPWARSTRTTRRKATIAKPTLLLLHPWPPPPSTIAMRPYWPYSRP